MPTSPKLYNLLLEVFYFGLQWELITKAEVVKWADDIIIATEEIPDYFFIELSMTKSITEAKVLIKDQISISNAPIIGRVLLGLIYHKLDGNNIGLQKACNIMDSIALNDTMADEEKGSLYQFSDELQEAFRPEHYDYLRIEILEFLSTYKDFALDNYDTWPSIYEQTETLIFNITQQRIDENENFERAQNHINFIHRFTIKMVLYLLILIAEIVIITKPDLSYKFNKDLYAISLLIFAIAMCYPIVWVINRMLIKLFRI
ncbi:hypothetical protein [Mucilaginibacter endophyticus]|uniref:hypothetical protein n=1 Tax=Mucilaginibacter endophyticus TaxID=2675003 RepID=UPI000E0D4604|nr:hypothetical protein [Mucilaginibacter endophyticus]